MFIHRNLIVCAATSICISLLVGCAGQESSVPDLDVLEARADAKGEQRIQQLQLVSEIRQASLGVEDALSHANGVNCIQFGGDVVGRLMGPSKGAMRGNLYCAPDEGSLVCDPGQFWKKAVKLSLSVTAQNAMAHLGSAQAVCKPSKVSKRIWVCGARADNSGDSVDAITTQGYCARY